ncbi:MAG: hypothetical protein AB8C84_12175 [Oligoflexales bacterium]
MILVSCDLNTGSGTQGRVRSASATQPTSSDMQENLSPNSTVDQRLDEAAETLPEEGILGSGFSYPQAQDNDLAPELELQYLVGELQSTRKIGCRGRETLVNVEIRVNGRHIEDRSIGRSAARRTSGQEATRISVSFADDVGFGFDERNVQIFSKQSSYPTDELMANFTSSLRYVQISKGGPGYRDVEVSEGSFIDEDVLYDAFETDRYLLESLEVWMNGEMIYQKEEINFIFQENSLVYQDDLSAQPFWFAYQAESQCQIGL